MRLGLLLWRQRSIMFEHREIQMSFNQFHEKFLNTLEKPGLSVGQQLLATAGKGRGQSYIPPTEEVIAKTRAIFAKLCAFDENPNQTTFDNLQKSLKDLNMKAVRVVDAPEWIYITPNAPPNTDTWEKHSKESQFNLSWHVGSDSKVALSDEHNGGDGCFRAVSELVKQGTNLKLVMSNSRNKNTSERKANNKYLGDWAHSRRTIDYPIMCDLATNGYSVINIHGMARRDYGLLVNNYNSNYIKDDASLPTFIGIALALYFNDKDAKKFIFAGVLPGSVVVNGARKLLSPVTGKSPANSLFQRVIGTHNTNKIGNAVNAINARMANRSPGDSGRSCHIEFGIIRDGRADLRKMVAAINLAAFWMNNYKAELNPWEIIKNDPNFDMLRYGSLYNPSQDVLDSLQKIANDNTDTDMARVIVDEKDNDFDDDDPEGDDPEDDLDSFTEIAVVAPMLPSGGPAKPIDKTQNTPKPRP